MSFAVGEVLPVEGEGVSVRGCGYGIPLSVSQRVCCGSKIPLVARGVREHESKPPIGQNGEIKGGQRGFGGKGALAVPS